MGTDAGIKAIVQQEAVAAIAVGAQTADKFSDTAKLTVSHAGQLKVNRLLRQEVRQMMENE